MIVIIFLTNEYVIHYLMYLIVYLFWNHILWNIDFIHCLQFFVYFCQMAFKFNFFSDETGTKEETPKSIVELLDRNVTKVDLSSLKLVPYYSNSIIRTMGGNEFHLSLNPNFEELKKIHSSYPGAKTDEETAKLSDWLNGPSDLIPGVYEGGFRLWEGACDLVEYLTNQNLKFCDKLVLELGTGIGLPGILALRKGAKVWFQEYNIEVLQCATIPHSFMNIGNHDDLFKNATFLSGSWSNLISYFEEISLKFDIILMAETIYEVSHYGTLLDIIDQTLTPHGKVIIAVKQTYFGLSGSTKEFKDFVAQRKAFQCSTVVTIETNVPREILVLSRII